MRVQCLQENLVLKFPFFFGGGGGGGGAEFKILQLNLFGS